MEAHAQEEVLTAGRNKLADELYDLRCDLANPDLILTVEQATAMQARADALEPLVGGHLQRMLCRRRRDAGRSGMTGSDETISRVLTGQMPSALGDHEQAAVRVSWSEQIAQRIKTLDLTERLRAAGRPWPEADADGNIALHDAGPSDSGA